MPERIEQAPFTTVLCESFWRILDKRFAPLAMILSHSVLQEHTNLSGNYIIVVLFVLGIVLLRSSRQKFALVDAVREADEGTVRSIIETKADVNRSTHSGFTPLRIAAVLGHAEIAKMLLDAGANVDQGPGSERPLLEAAEVGHESVARLLLDARAHVNQGTPHGVNPLLLSMQNANQGVFEALCDAGACLNFVSGEMAETPMMLAIRMRSLKVVELLCIEGADRAEADQLAEALASAQDGAEISRFLRDTEGFTSRLHYAKYMTANRVQAILSREVPSAASEAIAVAKQHPDAEGCKELLRLWVWQPNVHKYFPASQKQLVHRLLLLFKRITTGKAVEASLLQSLLVTCVLPFVIDRTRSFEGRKT
eukprot:TRINITY_DN14397_c0_g2_i2.p1 TRINITY_DN14397_c0_g2~~TRINITY_DN14397_c0_g2_i2.p1  ORF type:complete len:367 (-),score=50.72 TRINITY_DN14397_c0_g2_i2:108-1208(-)